MGGDIAVDKTRCVALKSSTADSTCLIQVAVPMLLLAPPPATALQIRLERTPVWPSHCQSASKTRPRFVAADLLLQQLLGSLLGLQSALDG